MAKKITFPSFNHFPPKADQPMAETNIYLTNLIKTYPYNPYRNYKIIPKDKKRKFLYGKISELGKREDVWVIDERGQKSDDRSQMTEVRKQKTEDRRQKGQRDIVGLLILEKLHWDTEHFGIPMAKIEYILTDGELSYEEDLKLKDKLIKQALKVAKENNIKHITAKIDTADNAGVYALQQNGFYLMDTILTYISTQRHEIPKLKDLYKIREAKEEDLPILMDLARGSFRKSRFHRDPNLSNKKADELYAEWVKNAWVGKMAQFILVAEKALLPVGFFTCKMDDDLIKYNIKCLGRGLAAVKRDATGAYVNLLEETLRIGMEEIEVDIGEFDVQIYNHPVIRAYEEFNLDLVKRKYIFYCWMS